LKPQPDHGTPLLWSSHSSRLGHGSADDPPNDSVQVAGENIQSKGSIRRSFVLETLPCQPQFAFVHEIFSSPNIFIAWVSESDAWENLRSILMLWLPLGHLNTTLYALLIFHNTIRVHAMIAPWAGYSSYRTRVMAKFLASLNVPCIDFTVIAARHRGHVSSCSSIM